MSDRHPKFRASGVPQALVCGGSRLLIERVAQSKSSSASLLGQWAHFQGASILVKQHGATAGEYLTEPVMPKGWEAGGFNRWMVEFYVQTVLTYCDVSMAIEVEAEFSHAFPRFDLSGHIDAFGITADGTEAVGFDLKAGSEKVDDAEQNAQILTYIVLLALAYPSLRKITFAIVQPQNNPDEGVDRITWATVEGEQLAGVAAYLERELNHAIDHEREINSDGWKQCRYCAAAEQCPAIKSDLAEMKMTLTDEHIAAVSAEPTIGALLEIEFARKKFTPLFDRAHDNLKERIKRDGEQEFNGTRVFIEVKNSGREITDNAAAAAALSNIPDSAYHGLYEFKPALIEKALAAEESARTGTKVPVESKVEGKTSGKSLYKAKLGAITTMKTADWLRIV